jgi:hypothetical protein
MGAAITLIKTYPFPGFGIGISLTLNVLGAYNMTALIIFASIGNF